MSNASPGTAGSLTGEHQSGERAGIALVMSSAIVWSFGGTIARFLATDDSWAIVFLRSIWAAAFLVLFLLWRDGPRKTVLLFKTMGYPGIAVALCFATASATFIVALQHTTVANILLIQASTPLVAALIGRLVFKERVAPATWVAIGAVILGVTVMVSGSLSGTVSPVGDMLAVLIALMLAMATIVTRRYAGVRMTPACCLGCLIDAAVSLPLAGSLAVSATDMALLFTFGALNLGLGMAFFVTGVRLLPAPIAALIGTLEPVLAPIWVWLVHSELPSQRTLIGGAIVVLALVSHILWESLGRRPDTT
ncbi:EamA domain-containing membrane protein RarD [Rhizobiales bacterium GAS191]|nr:EamA domain-containing membrane protein RarD [Rhizobiales bacterium GAS191]